MRTLIKKLISKNLRDDLRGISTSTKRLFGKVYKDAKYGGALRKAAAQHKSVKINLGCGTLAHPGWINVDMMKSENTFYHDLRERLPMDDQCAEYIHCEHFLEHLTQEDAIQFMSECFRLLKPGGRLRLILPDAEKYMRAYAEGDKDFFAKMLHHGNAVNPFRTSMEIINQMFRMGGDHLFAWDFETLSLYLKDAGFERIERSEFRRMPEQHFIDGEDDWRLHESIYLNAFKPN